MVSQSRAYKQRSLRLAPARAIVVVSLEGTVQFATDRARNWLRKVFGTTGELKRLPHSLARWLTESVVHGQARPFLGSHHALHVRIDLLHAEGNSACLLLEKTMPRCAHQPPQGRPLTKREAEVLSWVALGKSNAEIAEILQVCTKTVDKHLERIYPKLGVENRTAAASHVQTIAAA